MAAPVMYSFEPVQLGVFVVEGYWVPERQAPPPLGNRALVEGGGAPGAGSFNY